MFVVFLLKYCDSIQLTVKLAALKLVGSELLSKQSINSISNEQTDSGRPCNKRANALYVAGTAKWICVLFPAKTVMSTHNRPRLDNAEFMTVYRTRLATYFRSKLSIRKSL